jgi:nitroreductase
MMRNLSANPRVPETQVDSMFVDRWSPRAFLDEPIKIFASLLVDKNQRWAASAPLLMFVVARRKFLKGGTDNRHAKFDAGAAWMSLALQARKLGLYAHAMAGFHLERSYEVLGVPKEDYEVIAAVAAGRLGDSSGLPDDLRRMELPKDRKELAEVASDKFPFVK